MNILEQKVIENIITDLEAGASVKDVFRRYKMSKHGVNQIIIDFNVVLPQEKKGGKYGIGVLTQVESKLKMENISVSSLTEEDAMRYVTSCIEEINKPKIKAVKGGKKAEKKAKKDKTKYQPKDKKDKTKYQPKTVSEPVSK